MAEFLHPSVSSRIIDNSQVFVSAQGLTMLFAAFPAEQGPDNRPQLITSESEFLFYYGAPNMRKYGQTAYNVVKWLRSGGTALCMRVLPYIEKDADDHPLQQSTYPCYILEIGCKQGVIAPAKKEIKIRVRTLGDGLGTLTAADEKKIRDDASIKSIILAEPDAVIPAVPAVPAVKASMGPNWAGAYNSVLEAHIAGVAGNSWKVILVGDSAAAAGVTVDVNLGTTTLTAHYESGVSTIGDVDAAITALAGGNDVIDVKTAGTAATVLTAPADNVGITNLAGGADLVPEVPAQNATGFLYYPIMVIRGRDRGEKYNSFGVRLETNDSLDETYEHRLYDLGIYSSRSKQEESFIVSLYPEAANTSGISQFLPNVLSKFSNLARAIFSEENYDAVCAYINADPVVAKKLDILELSERKVSVAETLHADAIIATGSADLSPTTEVFLSMGGGTDGDWLGPNTLEALLYKAYSGSGDFINPSTGKNTYDTLFSDVWDKKAYPIDMIMDANYPLSVKTAISNFARTRGDVFSIVDVGFTGSPGEALKYRSDSLTLNTFFTAIFVQDFVVDDEFQGREIQVTPTYFLAEKIPSNDGANGIQVPFVGPRRGAITGQKSGSWWPNAAYREELYKAKLNYVEKDVRLTRFNTQLTSQFVNSALSDISHVRTLLRIRRDVENMVESYQFEFNDAQSWDSMQYSVASYMKEWVGKRALESAESMVYASAYDRQQRVVRVKISVVFTGLIERVLIDLVVNR